MDDRIRIILNGDWSHRAKKYQDRQKVKKVVVNERKGATTVFFEDDEVIVVKREKGTQNCLYKAVASAVAIKVHGSNTQFKKTLKNVEYI